MRDEEAEAHASAARAEAEGLFKFLRILTFYAVILVAPVEMPPSTNNVWPVI